MLAVHTHRAGPARPRSALSPRPAVCPPCRERVETRRPRFRLISELRQGHLDPGVFSLLAFGFSVLRGVCGCVDR